MLGKQEKPKPSTVKIVVIGDSNVGKTSILHTLRHREPKEGGNMRPTIGADFVEHSITVDDERTHL